MSLTSPSPKLLSAVIVACCAASACDKSWRDENFVRKEATQLPGVTRPVANPLPTPADSPLPPSMDGGPMPDDNPDVTPPDRPDATVTGTDASSVTPSTQATPTSDAEDQGSVDTIDSQSSAEPTSDDTATADRSDPDPLPDTTHAGEAPTDEPPAQDFSKGRLLTEAADCAMAQYQQFLQQADALQTEIAVLIDDPSDDQLFAARVAFVEAMSTFQLVEAFRVGPAARSADPGGQDLRDWMYAFPQINRCQVDRNVTTELYASDLDSVLFNARGMGTLEYLLFYRSEGNACSSGIDINTQGTWAALNASQLNERRNAYALAVATDVRRRAEALVQAWDPNGGGFLRELTDAGDSSAVFSTQQSALNALSHALFYLEKEVKDYKLGWPLGLVSECVSGLCPEAAESPYAQLSTSNIRQNLEGFRLLFEGCGANYTGVAFDDWLRAVNPDGDLVSRMLANLVNAQQVLADLPRPIEDAFFDAPDEAQAVHAAVKQVTDLLKTEFVTVLNLELPRTAEGDND